MPSLLFRVELSCSGSYRRHLLRLAKRFYCFNCHYCSIDFSNHKFETPVTITGWTILCSQKCHNIHVGFKCCANLTLPLYWLCFSKVWTVFWLSQWMGDCRKYLYHTMGSILGFRGRGRGGLIYWTGILKALEGSTVWNFKHMRCFQPWGER